MFRMVSPCSGAIAVAVVAAVLAAGPVAAQVPPSGNDEAPTTEKAIAEGMQKVLRALKELIDSVPMYELPEVLDNGDIIIRRKKRGEDPGADDAPDMERTSAT